jgi:predicted nucleic acid-binding protein
LRIAVIDSSSLIALAHLGLAKTLDLFFDVIYVPSAVQREVNRKQRFRYRLAKLCKSGIYQRCSLASKDRVDLLTVELDQGEAEALLQAQERNAAYFICDEKRARQIGEAQGLKLVGTLRILARLHLQGQSQATNFLANKLRKDLKFRVSDELIDQAIALAELPI